MATKKTTKTTTAKVTSDLGKLYIAIDDIPGTVADPKQDVLSSIVDCAYYCGDNVEEIMGYLRDDSIESNKGIYELSFKKVGTVPLPVLEFKSE